MKLFYVPGSCSRAPHIVLHEMGIKFESEKVDPKNKKVAEGDYNTAINPKGHVPALKLDDGQVLTETGTLIQFLADQKPEAKLIPKAGTFERYRLMEWVNFIGTDLHRGMGPLFNPNLPADFREMLMSAMEKRLSFTAAALQKHDYLLESGYSVADIYLFVVLGWAKRCNVDLTKWPSLLGHTERVQNRAAVQATLKAEA